jgi:hypothetical protein
MANLTEPMRAALLAQRDIATTQGYTHLRPVRELARSKCAILPIALKIFVSFREPARGDGVSVPAGERCSHRVGTRCFSSSSQFITKLIRGDLDVSSNLFTITNRWPSAVPS